MGNWVEHRRTAPPPSSTSPTPHVTVTDQFDMSSPCVTVQTAIWRSNRGETGHFQIEEKKEEYPNELEENRELFKANYSSQMMSCCQRRSLFSNQNAIMKLDTKNEENEDSLQLTK